jgi:hypothetical protein
MTEMVRSTGEDQGRDPEIATRNTSARTDTARAQGNTGGIDLVVKSVDVTRTTTEDHGTTIAITRERRAQSVRKDAVPTAVEADRGRHTSIQDHAEREEGQRQQSSRATSSSPPNLRTLGKPGKSSRHSANSITRTLQRLNPSEAIPPRMTAKAKKTRPTSTDRSGGFCNSVPVSIARSLRADVPSPGDGIPSEAVSTNRSYRRPGSLLVANV